MYGPRLAGVLTAVAVGPILIGILLFWIWTIFKKHHQDLSQDLEAPPGPQQRYCYLRSRIINQPPHRDEIRRAIGSLHVHLECIALHCWLNSKTSEAIPLSRLRSHLHELGDVEHRLPAERLLELLPGKVQPFVSHIIITTVIEAITVSAKSHLTILHDAPVALLTEVLSHLDPDDQKRRSVSAHLRECMAFLLPSEMSNQKAADRLTGLLTDLFDDCLGFNVKDDEEFRSALLAVFEDAIVLGTYLLCHPVEYRFDWDWGTGEPQSERQVVVFPNVVLATDDEGYPEVTPLVIYDGIVHCLTRNRDIFTEY